MCAHTALKCREAATCWLGTCWLLGVLPGSRSGRSSCTACRSSGQARQAGICSGAVQPFRIRFRFTLQCRPFTTPAQHPGVHTHSVASDAHSCPQLPLLTHTRPFPPSPRCSIGHKARVLLGHPDAHWAHWATSWAPALPPALAAAAVAPLALPRRACSQQLPYLLWPRGKHAHLPARCTQRRAGLTWVDSLGLARSQSMHTCGGPGSRQHRHVGRTT